MKILHLQVTLLVARRESRKKPATTKKTVATPLSGQLPLSFTEMSPPDSEKHT
jgi:hypothetical protein